MPPAELALHFERGQDTQRAVQYLHAAGEKAFRRSAYQEASALLTHGLELVATLPNIDEQAHQELRLLLTLGPILMTSKGQTAAEVEHTYTHALDLCHQLNMPRQRFSVLAGLRRLYAGRGDAPKAQALGEELLELASRSTTPRCSSKPTIPWDMCCSYGASSGRLTRT